MPKLHSIESNDFDIRPSRLTAGKDAFLLYDDNEALFCKRSLLNKLFKRHSPRYNVFVDDQRVGCLHGMYKGDKDTGKYGSAFFLELYDKCYACYVQSTDNDAKELVMVLQRYPYSVSSRKRFPLTPNEIPFASAYLKRNDEDSPYVVNELQHVELHQFANTFNSVICLMLSYIDLHGRDDSREFRKSEGYQELQEDNGYYWRQIDGLFV